MNSSIQAVFILSEEASEDLERLLIREGVVCAEHPDITIDSNHRCSMCDMDEALFRAAMREITSQSPAAIRPGSWVERAKQGLLPGKVMNG